MESWARRAPDRCRKFWSQASFTLIVARLSRVAQHQLVRCACFPLSFACTDRLCASPWSYKPPDAASMVFSSLAIAASSFIRASTLQPCGPTVDMRVFRELQPPGSSQPLPDSSRWQRHSPRRTRGPATIQLLSSESRTPEPAAIRRGREAPSSFQLPGKRPKSSLYSASGALSTSNSSQDRCQTVLVYSTFLSLLLVGRAATCRFFQRQDRLLQRLRKDIRISLSVPAK